ncbi:MAG: acetyl-CoA carboxylase biotin carboxyl carrier protein [Thermoanaerobaculia bacterium]
MAFLTFKEILELIDRVAERGISAVEVESAGMKVRVEGKRSEVTPPRGGESQSHASPAPAAAPSAGSDATATEVAEAESEEGLHVITSPIVGTFYRTPNPEAEAFVSVGSRITKGQVLCIVEAMKLMNEIEAEVEGVITRIYPQNGQPIEYGEKLFAVRLS